MDINRAYDYDGYVPVVHISGFLQEYASAVKANKRLAAKPSRIGRYRPKPAENPEGNVP
jgi:hypothetical protein